MVDNIKQQILREYPELELIINKPVTVTDNMLRVAWTITPRWLFDEMIQKLFERNISNFFRPNNNKMFFEPDKQEDNDIRKYTSVGLLTKIESDRIAHCLTLTCWGSEFDFQTICEMIESVTAAEPKIEALNERYGRSLIKTIFGDRYVLTHAITIEPAFPTRYIQELSNLRYDVHYTSAEQEQLEAIKQLAEAKNEEVLKGTY
jgi:hypothetical protein